MPPKPAKTRSRGRPPKPEAERKRSIHTMRIRDDVKAALSQRAAANGRSISEEIEMIVEQALQGTAFLDQALDLTFGPRTAGLLMVLARAMHETGRYAGFTATHTVDGANDWLDNPYAVDQAITAVSKILEAIRPAGDIAAPRFRKIPGIGIDLAATFENLGSGTANAVLRAVAGVEISGELSRWASSIRERLGPQMIERIDASTSDQPPVVAAVAVGRRPRR